MMESSRPYRTNFSRKLGIISAAVLLIFCLIVTIQAVWTHDIALERGELIAERLTHIESDHIELTFNSVNMTLKSDAEKYYYNSLFGHSAYDQMEEEFKKWVADNPNLAAWILIADNKGNVPINVSQVKYKEWAAQKRNLANENFFRYHKLNSPRIENTQALSISISPNDQNLIILSRPIYDFEGNFDGVVAVAINADYFLNFFSSIEIGDKIGMGIVINNGQIIMAQGNNKPQVDLLQVIKDDSSLVKADLNKLEVRRVQLKDRDYIVSFKKLHNMPVLVSLMFDEDEILASWRSDRMTDLVFLILFTVFGGVLFSLILAMAKQIQRSEESERRALLANQAKSEFFAKMSHELRTPLNAIIGFSEMIDSGYFGPLNNKKQQERIHDINLCGNHLLQLINDILDYSKGEAGKLEIREAEVILGKVVDESVRMIRERAKNKNVNLTVTIPGNLPRLMADEKKLKQIFLNLLSNAVKFTRSGGSIIVEALINKDNEMEVHVIDTGIGIPEDDIPTALSVFGQVKNRHEIEEEGTGLGLPLCKMLVELHGGQFILRSELGKGTDAGFVLPADRVLMKKGRKARAS